MHLQLKEKLDTKTLPPLALGSLPSDDTKNGTCSLFGWDATSSDTAALEIYAPKYCLSTYPEAYCAYHDDESPRICSAKKGSSISCSAKTVDGILLNTGCTLNDQGRYLSFYHSVGDYKAWIESVSGAETTTALSVALLVSAIALSLKNFL